MSLSLLPSEMVTELRSRLGDPTTSEIADVRILKWLNGGQQYICSLRSDWKFCYDLDNTITTTNGTADYNVGQKVNSATMTTGSGLDDLTAGGTYTQNYAILYQVTIDGVGTPNTFKWSTDGTEQATTVSITGSAQTLDNGVTVTFAATTGHTTANVWSFYATSDYRHTLELRDTTNDNVLHEKTLNWLRKQDPTPTGTGEALNYIPLGPTGTNNVNQIKLWEVPDSTDTLKHDYYRWLPKLETTLDLRCLIPDHELVMLLAEVRGRIDNEEPEDGIVVQGLYSRLDGINGRLGRLIKENQHAPNKRTSSRPARMLNSYRNLRRGR